VDAQSVENILKDQDQQGETEESNEKPVDLPTET
jgi:hypothetical protein